ncbi:hypothetical protein Mal52_01620 [Symmachiella dynata]|uniref:SseB protein N-terminal domain-containing protein n=1 Tax=Symmachiella dynata TaxID=2527995 RepID=A0A517ZGY2_9PLAN|nr:hypothetical protein [Symmachiella dynata]QDU41709.1 hypothetical protein Mal52_01620 [Symmachiella dynata]
MHELGTFELTYPCWALVHKDSIVSDEAGRPTGVTSPIKLLVFDDSSGGSMFPLFTDSDLAARFKKASSGLDDFVILAVKDATMMADGLRMVRGTADTVTLDKPEVKGKPYAIWPLEYAIRRVEAGDPL